MVSDSGGTQVVLRGHQLSKEYTRGSRPALAGVDIEVAAGGFMSVMGPSGSGKSTLLHLLGGLDKPTSGTVEVVGQKLDRLDDKKLSEIRRDRIGFVFQSYNLIPVLTTAQNIGLPGVIAKKSAAAIEARVKQLLELVGLTELRDKLPAQLSGGESQRVAVARALLVEAPLLLADEPTGNLDSITGRTILELLRQAADELGTAVVMVTHDASASAFADEVMLLQDGWTAGKITFDAGSTPEARAERVLAFLSTGEEEAKRRRPAATKAAATKARR